MKTKEIDVYAHEGFESWDDDDVLIHSDVYNKKHGKYTVKAKLIIEIPEKKIEITESELRIAMYEAGAQGYSPFHDMVIKKLGF